MSSSENIKLSMLGLPVMASISDFSKLTHVSPYTIFRISKYSDRYYHTYEIPKRRGKTRTISQPSKQLKGLQAWILFNILNKLSLSSSCKGFEKKTSIVDNVIPHKDSSTILNLDLKDFFYSIKSNKIYTIFKSIGYNETISTVLTKICTYKNSLPQGGPCSPKLANLSAWTLDVRIQGFVGKRGITYTRYADDLTFSGNNPNNVVKIIAFITYIIEQEGLTLNQQKTRIGGLARRKEVTGLIISDGKFGIGKTKYKILRSKIHHLTLESENADDHKIKEVQGWLSYLAFVDKTRHTSAIKYIRRLKEKHPNTPIEKISLPLLTLSTKITTITVLN